jgi:hypothetical protein
MSTGSPADIGEMALHQKAPYFGPVRRREGPMRRRLRGEPADRALTGLVVPAEVVDWYLGSMEGAALAPRRLEHSASCRRFLTRVEERRGRPAGNAARALGVEVGRNTAGRRGASASRGHLTRPQQKPPEFPAAAPREPPEGPSRHVVGGQAGVGFDAPTQVRACPGAKAIAASAIGQKLSDGG